MKGPVYPALGGDTASLRMQKCLLRYDILYYGAYRVYV